MKADKRAMPGFDAYADRYAQVINSGARASGETYEYMVKLRVGLFAAQIGCRLDKIAVPALLDFGCGTGCTVESLAHRFPGAILHGFDTSAESVTHAVGRKIHGAEFHHNHDCPLPFPDDCFDAIYSNGTFHHIPEDERCCWLRELVRVLKPEGEIVVFENNPLNPLMMQAMRRTPFDADASPVYARRLDASMTEAGFHCSRPRYYFFFPRWLKWLRFTEALLTAVPFGAQYFVAARKTNR